ncbi:hypothetical protein [Pseudoduganella flava]|uniref:Uncharacterized protein n=1 Tax=Pseudoduganella flava TaxID=871742 RepID=A0ABX6FNX8_9BURK|nr:hypothetical protein [Pseudoduganella flava]QGZ39015.1 hypothetical protein GO485_08100 [Pseudoduganella flava]
MSENTGNNKIAKRPWRRRHLPRVNCIFSSISAIPATSAALCRPTWVTNDDFGWFPQGSPFQLSWTAVYDTDFPVHALAPSEGQRATALSGTMAVNINRVAVQSDTLPNSANYFGVYRGAYQNGAVAAPAEPDLCQRSSVQLLPEIVPVQTIFSTASR